MLYSPAVDMSVAEPKVVVAHREDLWWLLAEACQLEHMIMCQYLFAEWTLKDKSDGLTDEQSEAIERWRGVLRGIAIEEMLHLALVANVMSSIGAARFRRDRPLGAGTRGNPSPRRAKPRSTSRLTLR